MSDAPGFVVSNLKIGGALAMMWQNQHFQPKLRVFNAFFVLNPER